MIIAQIIIILPIIISITIETLEIINKEYDDFFLMFNTKLQKKLLLFYGMQDFLLLHVFSLV